MTGFTLSIKIQCRTRVIIYKMKEIWVYMIDLFEDDGTYIKLFKKSDTLSQYNVFVNRIFSECKLRSR